MEDIYWADRIASELIKKNNKKYTIASGITPSGTIHIGNFREEMTVDIVRRALKSKGVKVKYIHSWDNYDRLRKVPKNIPEKWKEYIGMPVSKVPDPWKCHNSYAEHFEKEFEKSAKRLNINPEYIDETDEYENCTYSKEIRTALNKKNEIIEILNKYRKEPLSQDWWPIQIYCSKCEKDTTSIISYDSEYKIKYKCECGNSEETDFSKQGNVKLRWRVDWAMRWKHFEVDFEPGGKDHSTPGGSRDTSSEISKIIFDYEPPIYQIYDFVIVKGAGGKMSSSLGNVISPEDLFEVYLPETIRFFYAGTRPNKEFVIPMDDEVFKVYEDFYFAERVYFGKEDLDDKNREHWKRVYEMSVVDEIPDELPVQIPFRYMVLLSQIFKKEEIYKKLQEKNHIKENMTSFDKERVEKLIELSFDWAKKYADEKYVFELHTEKHFELNPKEMEVVNQLLEKIDNITQQDLYDIGKDSGMCGAFFELCYKILLNKEKGPRLIELIETIGKEKIKNILKNYL